jgi:hypothetical protein
MHRAAHRRACPGCPTARAAVSGCQQHRERGRADGQHLPRHPALA